MKPGTMNTSAGTEGGGTPDETKRRRERGEEQQEKRIKRHGIGDGRIRLEVETSDNLQQTKQEEPTTDKNTGTRRTQTRKRQEQQILETQIGTLNMSGISFGYRGKYIKTDEGLPKIRPGDKLREVTEMIKTQGI
eukprot:6181167-Pleurochrysis_carterae.AAC.3